MLQDFTFKFGKATSRMIDDKNNAPKTKTTSARNITLFYRIAGVMCIALRPLSRAENFRGRRSCKSSAAAHHAEIDIFSGRPGQQQARRQTSSTCARGARLLQQGFPL